MIYRLSTHEAAHRLMNDEYGGWTYDGAEAIVRHLEELEADFGEPIECNPIDIRCQFDEYASAVDAVQCCALWDDEAEIDEEEATERLREHTTVIPFEGGVIIAQF